jgi:ABC-type antimicrobial peptide transport system permease subunit
MTATDKQNPSSVLVSDAVPAIVTALTSQEGIVTTSKTIAASMVEATMQKTILTKVGELTGKLMQTMSSAFKVDQNKIASAFKFNLGEDELKRLFETMSNSNSVQTAETNLISLGYQDINEPTSISFYFKNFDSKELFIDFLDDYNKKMEAEDEEKVIKYTDITGILMSSVKVIVDSVSYVLIAFVSISLIVSSIMIGIITYISVLERTKEIGVLRAIGASKRNISSIFNAETFIVGLLSGILGILATLGLLIPTNLIIHSINTDITAVLPIKAAIVLVILSVILTLIGGLIPSRQAAKKDPVLALRSE